MCVESQQFESIHNFTPNEKEDAEKSIEAIMRETGCTKEDLINGTVKGPPLFCPKDVKIEL